MLVLTIEVPEARDRMAWARLREGRHTVASGAAVASATTGYAAQHANPNCDPLRPGGHPPFGRYRLIHHEATDVQLVSHYGTHLLLFEPRSGDALHAESFGRLGLLVFGGTARRRTQGGVRVASNLVDAIVKGVAGGADVALELEALKPRAWWQFWKSAPPPSESLTGMLEPPQAPGDELSLLEALLQKAPPRPARTASDDRDDRDFHRDRYDDRSSSSSEPRTETFRGGGGESGGGGASGGWGDAPRGPGVDGAGRIVGAAAAVGAVAAAAALAGSRAEGGTSESGGGGSAADTGTGTSY